MVDQVARALKDLARRGRFTTDQDLVFPSPDGDYLEDSALRRRYYKARQSRCSPRLGATR